MSVRSETLGEVIEWLGDEADREWERAKDGLSDGYGGFDAYTRAIQHCQDMLMDDTAEHGKPDEGGKIDILPRMNAGDSRILRFGFLFATTKQERRGR